MALKLFHITEFAESALLSPATQREASHPHLIVLLASLWLAVAGNAALWRELSRLPELSAGQAWWLGALLALMLTSALSALLIALAWRWTLKLTITLLLVLSAISTHILLTQGAVIDAGTMNRAVHLSVHEVRTFLSGQLLGTVLVLAVLPSVWLWRTPLRRFPAIRCMVQNAIFFGVSCALLAGLWFGSAKDLTLLMSSQPQLRGFLNPFNSLQALLAPPAEPVSEPTR